MQGGRGGSPPRNPRRGPACGPGFRRCFACCWCWRRPWRRRGGLRTRESSRSSPGCCSRTTATRCGCRRPSCWASWAIPAGAEPLAKALGDSNKTVRWMAAQSLARLGAPSAAPALKALLERERDAFGAGAGREGAGRAGRARPTSARGRIFLTFGSFSGGTGGADASALEVLRSALTTRAGQAGLGHLREPRDVKPAPGPGAQLGFLIDGNVSRLDNGLVGGTMEINCDVKVMVARWPSKSIILWTNAGAAVQGGSRPQDIANARRDCLEASAGQLGEDLSKFLQSQGG